MTEFAMTEFENDDSEKNTNKVSAPVKCREAISVNLRIFE